MRELTSVEDWEAVLNRRCVVLYKHSPMCGLSHRAVPEVLRFAEDNPDVPVYRVNVITNRRISNLIEDDLGIRHESPQVIVLSAGEPLWHASHRGVTAEGIEDAISDEPDSRRDDE